jgi:hypothetical protein
MTIFFSMQNKLDHLAALAARRKAKLMDNSAYLQFMWKADVVESWIADKETHVRSEEFGRDLSTVQTLLTKQETFDAGAKNYIELTWVMPLLLYSHLCGKEYKF